METTNTSKLQAFPEIVAFRCKTADKADLIQVAQQWELDESEIARRALRAGLEILRGVKLPGTRRFAKGNATK